MLHALSDPIRLAIVCTLFSGPERPCGALEAAVSKSTLSHHLKVLREAGLTFTRIDGTQRVISLRTAELDERFPGLLRTVIEVSTEPALEIEPLAVQGAEERL